MPACASLCQPVPADSTSTIMDMENNKAKLILRGKGGSKQETPHGPQITGVGGRNKWTRLQSASSLAREPRGPGKGNGGASRFSRGREELSFLTEANSGTYLRPTVANGKGNKWVSSSQNYVVTDESNNLNSSVIATESATPATATDNLTSNFEKRGTNKLVVKRKTDLTENTLIVSATQNNYIHLADRSNAAINSEFSPKPPTSEFARNPVGGNNFIEKCLTQSTDMQSLSTNMGGRHPVKAVASLGAEQASRRATMDHSIQGMGAYEASSSNSFSGKSRSWTRKPSDDTANNSQTQPAEGLITRGKVDFAGQNIYLGPQRKRKYPARRINLLTTATTLSINEDAQKFSPGEKNGNSEEATNENTIKSNESSFLSTHQKTLTDFCYQDTGGGRCRGRGRGPSSVRGDGSTGGRNMGLVRVKPNDEKGICATFLRGLQCNNPTCNLRHDVTTEALRPICVFFQRNGMCNKGDECPFRHVKVRWDAEKSRML